MDPLAAHLNESATLVVVLFHSIVGTRELGFLCCARRPLTLLCRPILHSKRPARHLARHQRNKETDDSTVPKHDLLSPHHTVLRRGRPRPTRRDVVCPRAPRPETTHHAEVEALHGDLGSTVGAQCEHVV